MQKSMSACELQTSAELRAAATPTGSGCAVGGARRTRGPRGVPAWRCTTNAARPSRWAGLSSDAF